MTNFRLSLVTLLLLPIGCATGVNNSTESNVKLEASVNEEPIDQKEQQQELRINVDETLGVISLNSEVEYRKEDTIKLWNDDGSLWYKFSYYYDDSDGKYDFYNPSFQPYAFNPDYFLLGLVVTDRLPDGKFKVEVNQKESILKYLEIESYLVFRKWSDQVLNASSVSFDPKLNPVRKEGNSSSENITYPLDAFFQPVEIEGEWLKVKWNTDQFGWIRWKENGFLIVGLSFYA